MRSEWTVVNATRMAEERGPEEPYGTIALSAPLGLRQLRANLFRFRPGDKMEYHDHAWQEEILFILDGSGTAVVEGARVPVVAGDVLHFGPRPRRQIVADGPGDLLWFAVGAPPVDDDWHEYPEGERSSWPDLSADWRLLHGADLEPKVRDRYVITWLHGPFDLRALRANLFRFRPGDSMYPHAHRVQEELFLLLSGEADFVIGDERRRLGPFDVVRVDPAPVRQLVHAGAADTVWLAVGAPPADEDALFVD